MFKYVILVMLVIGSSIFASDPEITITGKNSYNGYATVAGKVIGNYTGAVGITVKCGRNTYSTVADPDGNWGIVFRHTNYNFYVSAWDWFNPQEKMRKQEVTLPIARNNTKSLH